MKKNEIFCLHFPLIFSNKKTLIPEATKC